MPDRINLYRRFIRPILFRLDPERAHNLTLKILKYMYRPAYVKWVRKRLPTHPVSVLGLNFPNPVGLAAGLDKNGDCIDALFGLGFGFIEVGTVTPRPQPGNAKPRLFRLLEAEALINRYGFNNKGVMHLVQQLKKRKVPGIVGVNIGKNAITPLEQAFDDYRYCLEAVYPYADYVTVNVSSPNTPGLRDLQSSNYLDELLKKLKQEQNRLSEHYRRRVPLLLKISPDLSQEALQDIARLALHHQIDGLVATNTTLQRTGVEHCQHAKETGGLSGAPLFPLALNTVRQLYQYTQGQLPIIAVGGINSAERAHSLMEAGASLVQLYTGLIWDAGLAIGIASVSGSS